MRSSTFLLSVRLPPRRLIDLPTLRWECAWVLRHIFRGLAIQCVNVVKLSVWTNSMIHTRPRHVAGDWMMDGMDGDRREIWETAGGCAQNDVDVVHLHLSTVQAKRATNMNLKACWAAFARDRGNLSDDRALLRGRYWRKAKLSTLQAIVWLQLKEVEDVDSEHPPSVSKLCWLQGRKLVTVPSFWRGPALIPKDEQVQHFLPWLVPPQRLDLTWLPFGQASVANLFGAAFRWEV